MVSFYRFVTVEGKPIIQWLWEATNAVRQQKQYRYPYVAAAFTLCGLGL
jgi:hypothetical protein